MTVKVPDDREGPYGGPAGPVTPSTCALAPVVGALPRGLRTRSGGTCSSRYERSRRNVFLEVRTQPAVRAPNEAWRSRETSSKSVHQTGRHCTHGPDAAVDPLGSGHRRAARAALRDPAA